MKKLITFFLFMFAFTGCVGPEIFIAPIVSGVIAWSEGEAHKYYNYNSDTIYRVAKATLSEMELEISKNEILENSNYYIVAGNNDKFKITITPYENQISRLSIRVNFMGDKPYAELFYKKLDENISTINFKNGIPVKRFQ